MEETEYVKHKSAFLQRWWNPGHHDGMVGKWLEEILTREFNFNRYENQAKVLESVGLAEFTKFFEAILQYNIIFN